VEVNKNYDHAILMVTCLDPNVRDFSSHMQLFTNSNYIQEISQASTYFLFDNEQKGYYFITTEDAATKACTNISLLHTNDQVTFNTDDSPMMDFIVPGKTNIYDLPTIPETDFRIEAYYHTAKMMVLNDKEAIEVDLVAEKGKERIKLQSIKVLGEESFSVDFTTIFKKIPKEYKKVALDISNKGQNNLIINLDFKADQRQQVRLGQKTYFDLRKGEMINYKLLPNTDNPNEADKIYIFSSDSSSFVPSVGECSGKSGC
jgi:hypothetical protein